MENRFFITSCSIAAACGIALSYYLPATVAAPTQRTAPDKSFSASSLGLLENRFFSHAYAHDPVEKRLERLECLIFGSMKDGTNEERLSRLSKTVSMRSASPIPVEKAAPGASGSQAEAGNSTQYPILNTLEWRALKKTFAAESLDKRLDRLEGSLFGQPAQGMAYVDRVERLKKTLGIGIDMGGEEKNMARGPLPKARPRSGDDLSGAANMFAFPDAGSAPMPQLFPGTSGFDTIFGASVDRRFQQMFEEMNKHMLEAKKLGPGNWVFDQKTGSWTDIRTGKQIKPGLSKPGGLILPQVKPLEPPQAGNQTLRDLPLYSDPNSI